MLDTKLEFVRFRVSWVVITAAICEASLESPAALMESLGDGRLDSLFSFWLFLFSFHFLFFCPFFVPFCLLSFERAEDPGAQLVIRVEGRNQPESSCHVTCRVMWPWCHMTLANQWTGGVCQGCGWGASCSCRAFLAPWHFYFGRLVIGAVLCRRFCCSDAKIDATARRVRS